LVSFPPPTKMLPFGGLPLRKGACVRSLIQVSPVLRLHAPTRGISLLAAPFFGSQAEPFSRRRGVFGPFGGVRLAFGETLLCLRRCLLLVRGVILSFGSYTASLRILLKAELHIVDDLAYSCQGLF
jgi:hypothetical protein